MITTATYKSRFIFVFIIILYPKTMDCVARLPRIHMVGCLRIAAESKAAADGFGVAYLELHALLGSSVPDSPSLHDLSISIRRAGQHQWVNFNGCQGHKTLADNVLLQALGPLARLWNIANLAEWDHSHPPRLLQTATHHNTSRWPVVHVHCRSACRADWEDRCSW